jgi:serine/threonine protein kinase/WD40 repeat protein
MGEVFEAEDTQLGRRVAIKLLPDRLAGKTENLARFQREARALAALNHPNIVTIFSVEEADGHHFITMERVEGRPLSQLIPNGGLSLDKLFTYAIPVADALAAAHQRGIGHRDLKPSNIMVSDQGRVKVIDFGLAKLFEAEEDPLQTQGETTAPATAHGEILGTPAYMSPEQIEGRAVDHRTDIFSLGVLLCEMSTGQRPFKGDTSASIMSSILRDLPPALRDLKPDLPEHLGRIARHCLQKDPDERYQSALDVRNELKALQEETKSVRASSAPATPAAAPPAVGLRRPRYVVAAAILMIGALVVWKLVPERDSVRPRNKPVSRTDVSAAIPNITRLTTMERLEEMPTFSPDGRHIAFVASAGGFKQIFIREVGSSSVNQLTTDNYDHIQPAWGPETNTIYYARSIKEGDHFHQGEVKGGSYHSDEGVIVRHDLAKGDMDVVLMKAVGPTVAPGGKELFFQSGGRIWKGDLRGNRTVQLTMDDDHWNHVEPRVSADGSKAVFRRYSLKEEKHQIAVITTNHSMTVAREQRSFNPTWHPSGSFIYFSMYRGSGQNIWRLPLTRTNTAAGEPEPVTVGGGADAEPAFSPDGRRMVFSVSSQNADVYRLSIDPQTGRTNGPPPEPMPFDSNREDSRASWAPSADQPMVAFNSDRDGDMNIYIWREKDNSVTRITSGPGGDYQATWSGDLQKLTFWSSRSGDAEIYVVSTNANSTPVRLTHNPGLDINPFFSPDGKQIVFFSEREEHAGLCVMNADGGNQRRLAPKTTSGLVLIHFHPWYDNESIIIQIQPDPSRPDYSDYYRVFVADGTMQKLNTLSPIFRVGGHSSFSPDRRHLMDLNFPHTDIWVVSLTSNEGTSIYAKPAEANLIDYPWWSSDGRWVTFDLVKPRASELVLAEWEAAGAR